MKYTKTHEWIDFEGSVGTVGVTTFAQKELGDIVYVELPQVGRDVKQGQEIAVLESTKAAADIYSPVSGRIVEVNHGLNDMPELINNAPEADGWIFKIEVKQPEESDALLSADAYRRLIRK